MYAIFLALILVVPLAFWAIPQAVSDFREKPKNSKPRRHDPDKALETAVSAGAIFAVILLVWVTS